MTNKGSFFVTVGAGGITEAACYRPSENMKAHSVAHNHYFLFFAIMKQAIREPKFLKTTSGHTRVHFLCFVHVEGQSLVKT